MAEMRRADLTVEWKFEKRMLIMGSGKPLTYYFSLQDPQNTRWILNVHSSGLTLSASINRWSYWDDEPNEVEIESEFDLLVQREPDTPRSFIGNSPAKVTKKCFEKGESSEHVHLISQSAIDAVNDQNVLLLRCRIWSRESPFISPEMHFVRSPEYQECFTWTVKDFSLLERGDRVSYVLHKKYKSSESLTFHLFLDDNDTICLQGESNVVIYYIRSVSLVDAIKGKSLCFPNGYASDCFDSALKIPLVRKSELLEDRKKFLSNNQLFLFFDVRKVISQGFLEKILIGDSMSDNTLTTPNTRQSPHSSPGRDLYNLYSEGLLTDFELRIGSETVKVHRNILAARSPVFLSMLTSEMRESSQQGVEVADVEMDTAKHLLEFMYLNSIPDLDWNSAMTLYSAADKYEVVDLMKECSEILKSKLCLENVCLILSLADTHSDAALKDAVQNFIFHNEVRVILSQKWEEFVKEDKDLGSQVTLYLYRKRIETRQ